ncbi:MAG TPA: hypothetical protein VH062_06410 [Polyangiaceae bacterium]|nr:hypothetical protein [Polyangiaceae bacterium]
MQHAIHESSAGTVIDEGDASAKPPRGLFDRHLRLALFCTLIAWALALVRFYVALTRNEHGMDAVLAGVLSVAMPGIAIGTVLTVWAASRSNSKTPPGNVVPLPRGGKHGRRDGRFDRSRDAGRHS